MRGDMDNRFEKSWCTRALYGVKHSVKLVKISLLEPVLLERELPRYINSAFLTGRNSVLTLQLGVLKIINIEYLSRKTFRTPPYSRARVHRIALAGRSGNSHCVFIALINSSTALEEKGFCNYRVLARIKSFLIYIDCTFYGDKRTGICICFSIVDVQ